MKARQIKAKSFDATTSAGLDTAVNAWLDTAGEITLVSWNMSQLNSTSVILTIFYTEL